MMNLVLIIVFVFHGSMMFASTQDEARARALLEAVAEKRDNIEHFEGSVKYIIEMDSHSTVRDFQVKQLGDKLWCHQKVIFDGKLEEEVYFLKLGSEMYLSMVGFNQVKLDNMEDQVVDSIAPKTLGFSMMPNVHSSAREKLHLQANKAGNSFRYVSSEPGKAKVTMSHPTGGVEWEIDIEKLQILSVRAGATTVFSEYSDSDSLLPTMVRIESDRGGKLAKSQLVIKDSKRKPKPEDFELKSLNPEWGTPLSDCRIKRTVGFWNGQEFVEDLGNSTPPPAPSSWWSRNRIAIISAAIAVVTILIVARIVRRR